MANVSEKLYDRRIPIKLKGNFYKTDARPAMVNRSDRWAKRQNTQQRV